MQGVWDNIVGMVVINSDADLASREFQTGFAEEHPEIARGLPHSSSVLLFTIKFTVRMFW